MKNQINIEKEIIESYGSLRDINLSGKQLIKILEIQEGDEDYEIAIKETYKEHQQTTTILSFLDKLIPILDRVLLLQKAFIDANRKSIIKEKILEEKEIPKTREETIREKARIHYESIFLKNGKRWKGGITTYWTKKLGIPYDDFAKKLHKELVEEITKKYSGK